MKKFKLLLVSLLLFAFVVPFTVNAEEESDGTTAEREKINVYVFRGETCGYCANALSFFESIEEEYGKYYNLVTYEVWNDAENAALMDTVAEYLDTTIGGVPFIIIGEETFNGFDESWGEDIKAQIVDEYNKSDEERVDIIKNIENGVELDKSSNDAVISIVSILVIGGIVAFVWFARQDNKAKNNVAESDYMFDDIDEDSVEDDDSGKKTKTKSKSSESKKATNTKKVKTETKKKTQASRKTKKQ